MRALISGLLFLFGCCVICCGSGVNVAKADDTGSDIPLEYRVKAAFLHRFLKFVEWPATALPESQEVIRVGILGDSPIIDALIVINEKRVQGREMVVLTSRNIQDLGHCQVIFFVQPATKPDRPAVLQSLIAELAGTAILLVGEEDQFLARGGMINFVLSEDRLRFDINAKAATAANLHINANLLRLARRVID
ncbi:MAG: YfiR family protein [bacterium]